MDTVTINMTNGDVFDESCNMTLSGEYFENGSYSCSYMYQDFLKKNRLVFDEHHLAKIVVIWVIFFLSCSGNSAVLFSVNRRRSQERSGNTQLLMTHLAIANLIFTFFVLPMDALWNVTLEWRGGDMLCRSLNMLKQFSMYISSAMIAVMAIDRVANLLFPISPHKQRERVNAILAIAWIFSFVNSVPACVMFSSGDHWPNECKCPDHYIQQCVDFKIIHNGLGKQIFYLYSLCISFFIPVLCVIVCYVIIVVAIARMAKQAKVTEEQSSEFRPTGGRKSLARRSLARAKKMSQIVTGLITATFVVCWCPYYVIGVIHWFQDEGESGVVGVLAQEVMLLSMYLNPCLHPFIMVMLLKDVRKDLLCWKPCPLSWLRKSPTSAIARLPQTPPHIRLAVMKDGDDTKHVTFFKDAVKNDFM
ncbi:gonadotropin-releasing hormone receptor-like isoform X2 [Clavelina lepadiformis]|uniref:gonadotropin-releasing hormone receptor-like isoform X2 n=1 Tax=Clavelina lepadiformis TaxID=159417 RepID=UPI004041B89D